jgi:hypothetical protein
VAVTDSDILAAPPVPPDVDLRDFAFTPIFRARLFGSSFHARADDSAWRAGVTLWLKSWDQVPAGSLPDDDIDLCRLAELGRDLRAWRKLKSGALHGWFKCNDGRLYHWVVAEGVLEAWQRRRTASSKGKAGASKRWGTGNATAIESDTTAIAGAMPGDSKGQGQGQGDKNNPQPPSRGQNGAKAPPGRKPRAVRDRSRDAWQSVTAAVDRVKGTELTWRAVAEQLADPYADTAIESIGGHKLIADRTQYTSGDLESRFRHAYEVLIEANGAEAAL